MTLTLMISTSEGTIVASDLLVSQKTHEENFNPPTSNLKHVYDPHNKYRPNHIRQKLTKLADNVLLCWAGSTLQARAMAEHLKSGIEGDWWTFSQINKQINQFSIGDDNELEGFVLVYDQNEVRSCSINCWPYEIDQVGEVYCLGSGRPAFHEWAEYKVARGSGEALGSIGTALLFLGPAMIFQSETGYGLEEGWGGGFQIAYGTEEGWKYLDRILIRLWDCWYDNNKDHVRIGKMIYQFYEGDDLFVWLANANGKPGAWSDARTLFAPRTSVRCSDLDHKPAWIVDLMTYEGKMFNSEATNIIDNETSIQIRNDNIRIFTPFSPAKNVFGKFREIDRSPLQSFDADQ